MVHAVTFRVIIVFLHHVNWIRFPMRVFKIMMLVTPTTCAPKIYNHFPFVWISKLKSMANR